MPVVTGKFYCTNDLCTRGIKKFVTFLTLNRKIKNSAHVSCCEFLNGFGTICNRCSSHKMLIDGVTKDSLNGKVDSKGNVHQVFA
ncbi:hypothetical protein SDC9_152950 [bioreactor metagenome]|uniref:Uncharacterized protein n=1 Tax=bioreactor metagenome TaxID=1076179 RepID=A0A645EV26_9ZZZZ